MGKTILVQRVGPDGKPCDRTYGLDESIVPTLVERGTHVLAAQPAAKKTPPAAATQDKPKQGK